MTNAKKEQQQEEKVKPIVNLLPKYELEEACFKNALVRDVKTGKMYPWPKGLGSVEQASYEKYFLEKVLDSDTGKYFPKRDEDGKPVKTTDDNNTPKHTIHTIIRLKTRDNEEFLLSKGHFTGYDALGDPVRKYIPWPEKWDKTHFKYDKVWNDKKKMLEKVCVGPGDVETIYTMPFNEANLKELFDKRESDNIMWIVKDGVTGTPKQVAPEPNINDTFKLFLKPFSYLYNAEYITPQMKAQYRQEAIDQGFLAAPNTTITTPSNPPKGTYT